VRVAKKFIASLDEEIVPWNDFHETAHPARLRDASAGAIAVCGFQELARHGVADGEITSAKQSLLARLCEDEYVDFNEACCGVQKRGQGGKNGYTSWGDYYLMEALDRELNGHEMFW
jgi:unsaturated chondroitin disaccharide hydrolase